MTGRSFTSTNPPVKRGQGCSVLPVSPGAVQARGTLQDRVSALSLPLWHPASLSGAVSSEVSPLFPPGCCSSRAVFPWGVPAAPHSIGMKGAGNPARLSWVRSSLHGGFLLCGEEGAAVGAFTRQQLLEHELLKPLQGTGPALLSLLTHKSECERQFFHF